MIVLSMSETESTRLMRVLSRLLAKGSPEDREVILDVARIIRDQYDAGLQADTTEVVLCLKSDETLAIDAESEKPLVFRIGETQQALITANVMSTSGVTFRPILGLSSQVNGVFWSEARTARTVIASFA
jgi:hypothetical protein